MKKKVLRKKRVETKESFCCRGCLRGWRECENLPVWLGGLMAAFSALAALDFIPLSAMVSNTGGLSLQSAAALFSNLLSAPDWFPAKISLILSPLLAIAFIAATFGLSRKEKWAPRLCLTAAIAALVFTAIGWFHPGGAVTMWLALLGVIVPSVLTSVFASVAVVAAMVLIMRLWPKKR